MAAATLTRWASRETPSQSGVETKMRQEGLHPSMWSNGPGDRYAAHSHTYHKVLYCVRGSIRFDIPASGEVFDLSQGDRLDIPSGTTHSAVVGPDGVTCAEAPASS